MNQPSPKPRLEVRELAHAYGAHVVLSGANLSVGTGEIVGLLGPNGSGKSTLLKRITGLLTGGTGAIHFDGREVAPSDRAFLSAIGVVFQSPALDLKLTARENLQLAATLYGLSGAARAEALERAFTIADVPGRLDEPVDRLSGGMRRRVDIARALLPSPPMLVMDEPSAGLDEVSFRTLWDTLQRLVHHRGLSILVATHRADEADRCDRVAIIDGGTISRIATPDALRAELGDDLLVIGTAEPETIAAALKKGLDVDARPAANGADEVWIDCADGHLMVPRIFDVVDAGEIDSVELRRPDLSDAFLQITGRALDEDLA